MWHVFTCVYESITEDRIAMSIDGDVTTKKIYINSDGTSVQSTSATTSSAATTTSVNTVFEGTNAEENAKKLGLTKEEYLNLLNNPAFLALKTEEEKVNFIKQYKADKQAGAAVAQQGETQTANTVPVAATATQTQTTAPAASMEAETQQQNVAAENANKAEENTVVSSDTEKYEVTEDTTLDEFFNSKEYSKLPADKMYKIYAEEYAKNKFLYQDSDQPRSIDEWDNLSDKERKSLIKDAKKELKKEYQTSDTKKKAFFERKMTELQAAHNLGISIKEFYAMRPAQQYESVAEYLNVVKAMSPGSMSKAEQAYFAVAETTLNAVKGKLKEQGYAYYDNVCYGDISEKIKENKINLGVAIQDYLETKEQDKSITPAEQRQLDMLRKHVSPEALKEFGKRYGEISLMEKEFNNSDFADSIDSTTSTATKAQIMANHVYEKYINTNPEYILQLIKDANECGQIENVVALRKVVKRNPKLTQMLSKQIDDQIAYNVKDQDICNNFGENIGGSIAAKIELDPAAGTKLAKVAYNTVNDENVAAIIKGIGNVDVQEVNEAGVDRTYAIKDVDNQRKSINAINNFGSETMKDYAAVNVDRAHEDIQNETLHLFVDENGRRAKLVIENETVTRMAVKAQTEGFKTLQTSVEKFLPKDEAINTLKTLADQIEKCDASNQLDMHKSITNGKYEELQEYAASNIHKYDKSVQAEALKETYNSGNQKAIEAANAQIDKCDPEAVKSIENEVKAQIKAMEERHSEEVSENVGNYLTQMDAAKDPEASDKWSAAEKTSRREEYKQIFMKADAATKFRMISKLQGVWQKEIITHIATYCPELLSSLISSMGPDLFQLQLTPEIKNQIMKEMLNIPDMQANALEYFKDNPNNFSSSIKSTCAELMMARKDPKLESPTMQEVLRAELYFMSEPDTLSGGKVSNREYYNNKSDLTFWKRDKYGNFIG